jgi:hypothetical protein
MLEVPAVRSTAWSTRGSALLLALALAGFVAVLAVEIYRRAELTALRSDQAQFKDETRVVMEALAAQLQNPETCTRMLAGQVVTPGEIDGTPVALNYVYDPTLQPPTTNMTANVLATANMQIVGIEVFAGIPDRQALVKLDETGAVRTFRRFRASLRASFRAPASPGLSAVNFRRDFILGTDFGLPFFAWVDESNVIESCFGINSAGAVCNLARGYYSVPRSKTDPGLACQQTGFMADFDAVGTMGPYQGACRFRGIASLNNCSAAPNVVYDPGGIGYQYPLQIEPSNPGNTSLCVQCF